MQLLNTRFTCSLHRDRRSRHGVQRRRGAVVRDWCGVVRTAIAGPEQRIEEPGQTAADRRWVTRRGTHRSDRLRAADLLNRIVRVNVAGAVKRAGRGRNAAVSRRDGSRCDWQPGVNGRVVHRCGTVRGSLQRIGLRWRVNAGWGQRQDRRIWCRRDQGCVTSRVIGWAGVGRRVRGRIAGRDTNDRRIPRRVGRLSPVQPISQAACVGRWHRRRTNQLAGENERDRDSAGKTVEHQLNQFGWGNRMENRHANRAAVASEGFGSRKVNDS